MLQNIVETQKLFAKTVPVTIKDGYTNQVRKGKLFLTVEWKEASAAIHRQELLISLTNSNDPFFLYHLQLSEEDFQVLKSSQGLLVDFSAFPQKFIDLIEVCLAEENSAVPKFLLIFNSSETVGSIAPPSQLDVVETNPFKHLTHLSLKFIAATDSSVKQYLAVCFSKLKEEKSQLENRLSFLEQDSRDRLSKSQSTLDRTAQELERVRRELSVQLSDAEARHAEELREERDRHLNKQRDEEARSENERRTREHNFRKEKQQLEGEVSRLDALNKELTDQNYQTDKTIRDLRTRIVSLEDETKRSRDALRDYKEQCKGLQSEMREKGLQLHLQKDKIEELEKVMAFKMQRISEMQKHIDECHQQEKDLKEEIEDLRSALNKSISNVNELESNIVKANTVIQKLQREIQTTREKLKRQNLLTTKQEYSISEKDKIIHMMQAELKDIKMDLKNKYNEVKHLEDSVEFLQKNVKALEKGEKDKDNVIKYLNRQLTERNLLPQYVPPSNLGLSPPSNEPCSKRNSGGDAGTIDISHPPPAVATEKPKTFPTRNGNSSALRNNTRNSPTQLGVDSAYTSFPSCKSKNTSNNPDRNTNADNFEIDSDALSAAFGSDKVLKHSTAKKYLTSRTPSSNSKKSWK